MASRSSSWASLVLVRRPAVVLMRRRCFSARLGCFQWRPANNTTNKFPRMRVPVLSSNVGSSLTANAVARGHFSSTSAAFSSSSNIIANVENNLKRSPLATVSVDGTDRPRNLSSGASSSPDRDRDRDANIPTKERGSDILTLAPPSSSSTLSSSLTPSYTSMDYIKAYSDLSKARLSALVVTTTAFGFLAAGSTHIPTLIASSLGTALCSSSASTFNQIFEVERDSSMKRTARRPLVTGILSKDNAALFGTTTAVAGGTILYYGTDPLTTTLGVVNILLYAGLYTHLKPRSESNTWVGAIVGAVPPIMGYTAATAHASSNLSFAGGAAGDMCALLFNMDTLLLGGTLYLWQFPHFFALSYMHRKDYARGGFQMVPVNDEYTFRNNGDRTATLIRRYTWYLSALPLLSTVCGVTSSMFAIEGLVFNGYALYVSERFYRDRTNNNARKVFLTSLWYLPCFMMLFLLHSEKWRDENTITNTAAAAAAAATTRDEEEEDENAEAFLSFRNIWNERELHDTIQKWLDDVRTKGRELCVHEAVVSSSNNSDDDDDDDEKKMEKKNKEQKCPIVLGKHKAQDAKDAASAQVASTTTAAAVAVTSTTSLQGAATKE